MSGVIDKNIVQMVFDNALFQKNAQDTLSTLDKLKEALNFEGAVKGLENLSNNIKSSGMDALYNGVYKVQDGFNALDVVATRVLQNITDKVQGLVTQLANDALVQPLKDGFAEYELQMDSVQTIMSSTGKSVGVVNGYLDELNEYADRTIYSFSDMTANIGKFTNAGVELDKAVAAIQGVSNVAAVSGANTNEASRAMYNFAQALSAGSVKLIDWKSIENANMATVEFKEQLIQTAVAMGTLVEENGMYISTTTDANGKVSEAFNATKMFNDSLSSQWMTTEVLVQTLQQYSTDVRTLSADEKKLYEEQLAGLGYTKEQIAAIEELGIKAANAAKDVKTFSQLIDTLKESLGSGWTKTWQLIFGDLNEAKVLWTGINDVLSGFIGKVSDSRNEMLETWHKSGYTYNKYGELIKAFYDSEGKLVEKLPEDGKIFDQYGREVKAVVDQETGEIVPQLIENGKMIREEMGGRDFLLGGFQNIFDVLSASAEQFSIKWKKSFLGINNSDIDDISITGEKLVNLSRDFYDATLVLKNSWLGLDVPQDKLDKFSKFADLLADNSKNDKLDKFNKIAKETTGVLDKAYADTDKLDKFNKTAKGTTGVLDDFGPKGKLAELANSFEFFAQSMRTGFEGIRGIFDGVKNVLDAFFHSSFFSFDSLNSIISAFSAFTGVLKDFGDGVRKHLGTDNEANREGLMRFFSGLQGLLESTIWTKIDFITNGLRALGSVVDHILEPFGGLAGLLGNVGDKMSMFAHAIDSIVNTEDVSKFETFFTGIANGFNNFIDTLRSTVDFSAFNDFFNYLIEAITSDKVDVFKIFENVFGGLVDIFKAFLAVATPVATAFANIFGPAISEALTFIRELSDRFKAFTSSLVANEQVISGIQNLFEGVFSVLKAVGEVIGNVLLAAWDSLGRILASILPDGQSLGETLTNVGDKLKGVSEVISSLVSGEGGATKLSDIIANITDKFVKFFDALKNINLLEKFKDLLGLIGDGIKRALGGTEDMSLLDVFADKIKGFLDRLKSIFSDDNGNLDFVKIFEAGGIGVMLKKLFDFLKDIGKHVSDAKGIFKFITEFKDIISDVAESIQGKFKAESVKAIATAMLEIAGAMFILAAIDPIALGQAIIAMNMMFEVIESALLVLSKIDKGSVAAGAGAIAAMGTAILEMTAAVYILGSMDLLSAAQGVLAIAVMLEIMVGAVKKLSAIEKDVPKVAASMIALAFAIDLLVIPVKVLGGMDLISLAKGLVAVAAMMAGLVIAMEHLGKISNEAKMGTAAASMLLIAVAIKMVGSSVKSIANLSWEGIAKGLVVMAAGLIAMVGAASVVSNAHLNDELLSVGASLLMLGAAMALLSLSINGLAGVSWEDLGKAAAVLAGALVMLGIAAAVINGPNLLMIGSGILMVAQAVALLVAAITAAQIIEPIVMAIGNAFTGINAALTNFANNASANMFLDFLKNAILFLPQLAVGLAQALIEMVVTLGEGAGKIVAAVVKLGKEILKSVSELLPEIFNVVRTFIEQIINTVITEVPRIFEALNVFFTELWAFLIEQTPHFFEWLTTVVSELLTFLQTQAPMIIETIRLGLDTILQAIITEAPVIGETLLTLLHTVLDVINTAIPEITSTLLNLLTTLLQQLAEFVPQMAQAALEILLGFLQAVAENIGQITESAIEIALAFMAGITEKMPEIVDTAFKMIIGFIDGLASAIEENHNALFDAVGHLIQAIIDAILDGIIRIGEAAGEWITGPGGLLDSINGFFKDIFDAGANLVQGFIDGLCSLPESLWNAACGLGNQVLGALGVTLEEHSPSKKAFEQGRNYGIGLINGIHDISQSAADETSAMASGVLNAMSSTLSEGSDMYSPTVSPVIDDSNIKYGAEAINSVISGMSDDVTAKLTVGISDDLYNVRQEIVNTNTQLKNMEYQLDRVYDRMDYWLESIEADTLNIVGRFMRMTDDGGPKIYMDTGALVGAIAPEMDNALGMRQVMTERGVY